MDADLPFYFGLAVTAVEFVFFIWYLIFRVYRYRDCYGDLEDPVQAFFNRITGVFLLLSGICGVILYILGCLTWDYFMDGIGTFDFVIFVTAMLPFFRKVMENKKRNSRISGEETLKSRVLNDRFMMMYSFMIFYVTVMAFIVAWSEFETPGAARNFDCAMSATLFTFLWYATFWFIAHCMFDSRAAGYGAALNRRNDG
jgi:hypothetical protein